MILLTEGIQNRQIHRDKVEEWLPGLGGERNEELFNGYRVSVWGDKKVLEMDNCDGCTTL